MVICFWNVDIMILQVNIINWQVKIQIWKVYIIIWLQKYLATIRFKSCKQKSEKITYRKNSPFQLFNFQKLWTCFFVYLWIWILIIEIGNSNLNIFTHHCNFKKIDVYFLFNIGRLSMKPLTKKNYSLLYF